MLHTTILCTHAWQVAFFLSHTQHHPVYPTPQGVLFQKYISSLTSDLLPLNDQQQGHSSSSSELKGSLSKLSMASTSSAGSTSTKDYYIGSSHQQGTGIRKFSSWGSTGVIYSKTGSKSSREVSPASVGNLSMDELETEETTLWRKKSLLLLLL